MNLWLVLCIGQETEHRRKTQAKQILNPLAKFRAPVLHVQRLPRANSSASPDRPADDYELTKEDRCQQSKEKRLRTEAVWSLHQKNTRCGVAGSGLIRYAFNDSGMSPE